MAQTKKCGYIVHPCQSNRQVIEGQYTVSKDIPEQQKKREAASECEKQRQKSRLDQNVDQWCGVLTMDTGSGALAKRY